MKKFWSQKFILIKKNKKGKIYKIKLQGEKEYKRILKKDISYVDHKDWIKYLSKNIVRNINTKKYKLSFTSKLSPSLKYGDYIAINNSYLKIVVMNTGNYEGYKTYELYRVSNASHNIEQFTTSISAYTVDTTSLNIQVYSGATQDITEYGG